MAHHKSAKKRIKTNAKKRLYNRSIKSRVKTYVKYFMETIENAEKSENAAEFKAAAEEKLRTVVSELQKASSKSVYHKNTTSNKVSRLTKAFNKTFA